MADNKLTVDKRNPFAPWGFYEDYKFSVQASVQTEEPKIQIANGMFASKLIESDMKNVVAANAQFVQNLVYGMPESFITNNEATVYPNVATNAYGMDKDLQPVREPGENLDYYGIQAYDLYGVQFSVQNTVEETTEGETQNNDNNTSNP